MLLDSVILLIMGGCIALLFMPALRNSDDWRATVTPLASIIGSGFLVVAPLLGYAVGIWAPLAMLGIVLLAYAIGAVVRFNIRHLEPLLNNQNPYTHLVERLSNVSLAVAYLISVTFYVRLLVSFLLHPLDIPGDPWIPRLITSIILGFIGVIGVLRGLRGLEWMEEAAVSIKLSIIAALLVGLLYFDLSWLEGHVAIKVHPIDDGIHALRVLAGMLLVVQGFETSRYLGDTYNASMRIHTMRYAQWLAGAVYVLFVSLALPLLGPYQSPPSETAIIGMSQQVASALPGLLLLAAIMSQLSAAVADTLGSGGMLSEASNQRLPERMGYGLVVVMAIGLVWSIDIFGIIAIASRAFAIYYLVQCGAAWMAASRIRSGWLRLVLRSAFGVLGLILLLVVIFAIPAESG